MEFFESKVRQCVFCGATPVTREHVIPKWISKLPVFEKVLEEIEKNLDAPHYLTKWKLDSRGKPAEPLFVERGRKFRPHQTEVPVVCKDKCNGGWMSDLEQEVRPYLTKLIEGEVVPLNRTQLSALSRWACKTAMMMEFNDKTTLSYSKAQYSEAYIHRGAVEHTVVSMARFKDEHPFGLFHTGSKISLGKHTPHAVKEHGASGHYRVGVTIIVLGSVALMVHNASSRDGLGNVIGNSAFNRDLWQVIKPIELPDYVDAFVPLANPELFADMSEVIRARTLLT